jgi:hypothetical protein
MSDTLCRQVLVIHADDVAVSPSLCQVCKQLVP